MIYTLQERTQLPLPCLHFVSAGFSVAYLLVFPLSQALQAPACHENLVKVGGYILGEFGNLIAGDPRSR